MNMFQIDLKFDLDVIEEILNSTTLIDGEWTMKSENYISGYLGERFLLTNSFENSVRILMDLLGINDESVILTSPFTCLASVHPLKRRGAKLVYADLDSKSGLMSHESIQFKLDSNNDEITHVFYPFPCGFVPHDLDKTSSLCRNRQIPLIFDLLEAFGSKFNGKELCHYSDYSLYSFETVRVPSGVWLGGISSAKDNIIKAQELRDLGLPKINRLDTSNISLGVSARPSELYSYLLYSSMLKYENYLERRRNKLLNLESTVKKLISCQFISLYNSVVQPNLWLIGVLIEDEADRFLLENNGLVVKKVHRDIRGYHIYNDNSLLPMCDTFIRNYYIIDYE